MSEARSPKAATHPPSDGPSRRGSAARAPELTPPAESRRRLREFWISLVLAAVVGALLLLPPITGLTQGVGDSGLFLFLNAVTVMLILLLGFLIARNFWRLVSARRKGILGSKLNLKFAVAFVLIALMTTSGLFIVSAFFIAQSIDKWFSVQVDRALKQSGEVAEAYYESTAESALFYGERIAEGIAGERLLLGAATEALEAYVLERQREYNLGVVEVFAADGRELVSAINPEIPAMNFSSHGGELVRNGLAGESVWRAQEVGSGDVIRAVVPIVGLGRPAERLGAVVVNSFIPFSQSRKVASIRATLDEYRVLQPTAGHIRSAYLLELLLAFLVILMLASWMGLRLAKSVTGPIRLLAEGTAEVARGNLDVVVERTSDDEVGFLVQSFNRMTHDLLDARTRIEQSNEELERRRRYMEAVVGTIGAGVVSLDATGRIHTINPAAERYLDIPPGTAAVGRTISEVARCKELLELLAGNLQPAARGPIRRQVQVPIVDDVAALLVTVEVLHGDSGERLGTVVVLDDYSQLVKVQRMEAWREVARRIAHEIKNPLTPIQLSAQRIRRRFRSRFGESDDARVFDECVDSISDHVDSLKVLVDEFSNFARLPAADPKPADLNRIVRDAVASYQGTEGVEFDVDLDDHLPTLELDRDQIRRMLTNLIDNAVAAVRSHGEENDAPGRIHLGTSHDAAIESVLLEIADDGVGIPPEDRRRVFEPYFSTKRQGTGLGLAIVSRIVSDHRGYVRARGVAPHGTRVVVELPVRGA
ncbi:MAG: HAMP domain-containing protein [Deltaproteobacteria bacterium]|nr:HAMP domain-containing protein [Deltaproteobacteria bacterium]MBW2400062.1 HAMP domain-containing protein [Deltaproteobacteria bacterium]